MSSNPGDASHSLEPRLEKLRHVKYWQRCIKTFLPHQYTGNDSNRMYLAFLMVSALDLLGVLDQTCSVQDREDYVNWVYRCQHPDGGFRAWPGTDFGERANSSNAKWDPANVPATYFALAVLLIFGDDFQRVKRRETLQWLRRIQRKDGSFGETFVNGSIEGGRDPRFGYCACGVRYILRGQSEAVSENGADFVDDVEIDSFVRCIRASESYDGGIADEPYGEPHAGYTFCSLGALNFVGRLKHDGGHNEDRATAPVNPSEVLRWLAYRQTELVNPNANTDSEFTKGTAASSHSAVARPPNITTHVQRNPDFGIGCAGMNGRTNKVADTCYAWWAGASLHMMGQSSIYDRKALRTYLLGKTQHTVLGGFGKFPGDMPDMYHSYLALAALSLAGSGDVKEVDAGMCLSKEAKARLPSYWKKGYMEKC